VDGWRFGGRRWSATISRENEEAPQAFCVLSADARRDPEPAADKLELVVELDEALAAGRAAAETEDFLTPLRGTGLRKSSTGLPVALMARSNLLRRSGVSSVKLTCHDPTHDPAVA
jgi:hypothetical protein